MDYSQSLISQYKPKANEIWYHYCSAESFMAITKNKTLRFCDLRHMNDMEELIHGERMFNELFEKTRMSDKQRVTIKTVLNFFRERAILLSMSFSENGDQLSQWRGYADDAKGFSIGFNAEDFNSFPVHLLKIEYQIEKQKELLREAISKITTQLTTKEFDIKSAVWIAELFELFSMLKNESFCEEREFRLVRTIFVDEDSGKLIDINSKSELHGDSQIGFRLVKNIPTPYVDHEFTTLTLIRQIVIGPKNRSTPSEVDLYLRGCEIQGVKAQTSSSTYC